MASPSLNATQIRKIEALIMSWKTKLTWELLVQRIKSDLDITTTRQTLPTYKSIKESYDYKKVELRGTPKGELHGVAKDGFVKFLKSDIKAFNQLESLRAENKILIRKNEKQLSFIRKLGELSESNPSLTALLNKVKQSILQDG